MAAFSQLIDLWADADSDERFLLAASLFEYLDVDLDDGKIVGFRLHPWADQYLCLRAEQFNDDEGLDDPEDGSDSYGESEITKNRFTTLDSDEAIHDPNGTRTRVSTLKGWCPRPLDDGAVTLRSVSVSADVVKINSRERSPGDCAPAGLAQHHVVVRRSNRCIGWTHIPHDVMLH